VLNAGLGKTSACLQHLSFDIGMPVKGRRISPRKPSGSAGLPLLTHMLANTHINVAYVRATASLHNISRRVALPTVRRGSAATYHFAFHNILLAFQRLRARRAGWRLSPPANSESSGLSRDTFNDGHSLNWERGHIRTSMPLLQQLFLDAPLRRDARIPPPRSVIHEPS